jgi:hypothetical protein
MEYVIAIFILFIIYNCIAVPWLNTPEQQARIASENKRQAEVKEKLDKQFWDNMKKWSDEGVISMKVDG